MKRDKFVKSMAIFLAAVMILSTATVLVQIFL